MTSGPIIVNLFGGPSTGKSTLAAAIFYSLKTRQVNCELITEFAKDVVWEGNLSIFDNQLYVYAQQHHKLFRCLKHVDVMVVDSPILMPLVYQPDSVNPHFNSMVIHDFNSMNNLNIFLQRGSIEYDQVGRYQNEQQSREVDTKILSLLDNNKIQYTVSSVDNYNDNPQQITQTVLELLKIEQ